MATVECKNCGQPFMARRSDAKWCSECAPAVYSARFARYEGRNQATCPQCGAPIQRRAKLCRLCENQSRKQRYLGENNPFWKGGRGRHQDGYTLIRTERNGIRDEHLEHIIVWERAYGPLHPRLIVHHINEIRTDNEVDNLAAMSRSAHRRLHTRIKRLEQQIRELQAKLSPDS